MKQVLIIADLKYSTARIPRLIKHLPQFGWQPTVLNNPQSHHGEYKVASPKLRHIRPLLKWLYKPIKEITEYPDKERHWATSETAGNYDAIISSSPPPTTHIIAKHIKQKYGTPWIADLRDLWTQNLNYPYSRIRRWREQKLEKEILQTADILTSTSEPWVQKLSILHRKQAHVITNSYDLDDYPKPNPPLTPNFTITYTGQIYEKAALNTFIEGLSKFQQKHSDSNIEVRFYGTPPYRKWPSCLKHYGVLPHQEAVAKQRESQVLLLLKWNPPDVGMYTGKVFEYLGAHRPILVVGGCPDVLSDLLIETHAGVEAYTADDVAHSLWALYREFKLIGRVNYWGITDEVAKHTSIEMAQKFSSLLDEVSLCRRALPVSA